MLDTTALIFAASMSVISFVAGGYMGFKRGLFAGLALGITSVLLKQEQQRKEAEDEARTQDVSL